MGIISTPKLLSDFTDEELRQILRENADLIPYPARDIMAELDRREERRRATKLVTAAVLSAAASVVSALVALGALLLSRAAG